MSPILVVEITYRMILGQGLKREQRGPYCFIYFIISGKYKMIWVKDSNEDREDPDVDIFNIIQKVVVV